MTVWKLTEFFCNKLYIYYFHHTTPRVMSHHIPKTWLKDHPRMFSLATTSVLLLSQMGNAFASGGGTIG